MEADYNQPGESVSWTEIPTQYPRNMKAQEHYAWWKPIIAFVVGTLIWMVISVIIYIPTIFATVSNLSSFNPHSLEDADPASPVMFGLSLAILALFIVAIAIVTKIFKMGGLGAVSSVAGKLRWDRIKAFAPITLLIVFIFIVGETAIGVVAGSYDLSALRILPVSIIVVIILAPLQSAGEEYLFRGFLFQTLGSWIPVVIIPLLIQAVIFGSVHSQYNIVGMIECSLMGLVCAYMACKTGGLEASICLHACNNTVAMLITCFLASTAPEYDVDLLSVGLDIVMQICVLVAVMAVAKKKGFLLKK